MSTAWAPSSQASFPTSPEAALLITSSTTLASSRTTPQLSIQPSAPASNASSSDTMRSASITPPALVLEALLRSFRGASKVPSSRKDYICTIASQSESLLLTEGSDEASSVDALSLLLYILNLVAVILVCRLHGLSVCTYLVTSATQLPTENQQVRNVALEMQCSIVARGDLTKSRLEESPSKTWLISRAKGSRIGDECRIP